jgi:hypothetical protein
MRIALFYANWEKFGEPWSTPLGVKWELLSRGHEVRVYNLYHADGQLLPKRNIRTYSGDCFNQFNLDFKDGYHPDAVVVMDYGPYDYVGMDTKYFDGVSFILEAGDTPQSMRMHAQKAHKFDAIVTPDWGASEEFNKHGIRCEWMPHWADNRIFHDEHDVEAMYDVVTTCGGRALYKDGSEVTALITRELGDRFNNDRYFFGEDHARQLLKGHIVFQCSQFGEITRRVFEGMACGRMVLTDRLPEATRMEELFVDGEDIVYYEDGKDAVDKINYYIDHPEERERIARNGYIKVMQEHTITNRVDVLERLIYEVASPIVRTRIDNEISATK